MPRQARINIRSNAVSKPREEMRNGRKVVIVSSATMPDGIIMNEILYPAEEIAKSFDSLDRAPAPLGHPMVNKMFVSARDPEGINANWVGAWNENVRQDGGRVLLDKVIDVEVANRTEAGRGLMLAINNGQPIHTSTGLLANLDTAPDGSDAKFVATDIVFDHDAILMNEDGAATPEQGVGMFVNSAGNEIEVINSFIEDANSDLEWAADMAVRAVEKLDKAPMIHRLKSAIMDILSGNDGGTLENNNGVVNMADDKQLDALSTKVSTLEESVAGIGDAITNAVSAAVKPLTDNLAEIKANQDAKDTAELDSLVATIIKANVLDEAEAKELTLNAARALAAKAAPGKAFNLNGSPASDSDKDEFAGVDLNAAMKDK